MEIYACMCMCICICVCITYLVTLSTTYLSTYTPRDAETFVVRTLARFERGREVLAAAAANDSAGTHGTNAGAGAVSGAGAGAGSADGDVGGSVQESVGDGTKKSLPLLLNTPHTPLVLPCLTPRFVPTCTGEMMERMGVLSRRYGLPLQSHLSGVCG